MEIGDKQPKTTKYKSQIVNQDYKWREALLSWNI